MSDTQKNESIQNEHRAARPLKFVKDKDGNGWLCDTGIDINGDLKAQGCWRCDEVAFPMGGR